MVILKVVIWGFTTLVVLTFSPGFARRNIGFGWVLVRIGLFARNRQKCPK
jgi:hypothetical protein